ncbi:MAG: SusF/SusE family outer membrane protein [Bacteroidetes bacterium]|nr:MAG: SusF/SusE family outer membrane protein [Bacteroidota bacterium]
MIKKILYLMTTAVVLFALSCGKGEFFPGTVYSVMKLPVITSPVDQDAIVLLEDNADNAFTVTWSPADFGFQAAATYTIEIDRAGNDFANPVIVGTSTGDSWNGTVSKFNTSLFTTLSLPGEAESEIEMRLSVKVSPEVDVVYSAPITLKVTPYTIVIVYPQLQVPGNYQGWNPADDNTVIYSLKSDGRFEGYIYMNDASPTFKYTDGPSWDVNYGDTGADGTLDAGGTDITAASGAGMYKLNVNLNDLTHKYELTSWGVIGDATPTGWDNDTDMVFDDVNNKLTLTLDLTAGGKIKFRANDDWVINLGDDDANGSLEYGGADIPIAEAGNYTIDLILNKAVYTYKLTKN